MEKRMLSLYIFFCFCFGLLMVRIMNISRTEQTRVGVGTGTRTIEVATTRGKLYDRNLQRLTDAQGVLKGVVTPVQGSIGYLPPQTDSELIKDKLKKGSPFIVELEEPVNNEFIRSFRVPVRYSEQTAVHIIGYTDSTGKVGLSGIEKGYDSFLSEASGSLSVSFQTDAKGRVLAGMDKYINDNNFDSCKGILLTIDKQLQLEVEKALEDSTIESGCALVMQVNTGELLALASVPEYDPDNVSAGLLGENSPFVNKALQSYSVGSVFKSLIAAAALESTETAEREYECKGEIAVGDKIYRCYNSTEHGIMNMQQALENSCNCYFIDLIMDMDVEYLLELCRKAGLGSRTTLARGIVGASGQLPDGEELESRGELANLAFGQGTLLMTPVQMAMVYHIIATGRTVQPSLIYGFISEDGIVKREERQEQYSVLLSDYTVENMRKMLFSVTENGNAGNARSELTRLCGKTGTAQSGIYRQGEEICRTWFAGFFPEESPEYIVVVLNEDGSSGNSDCAPVFRKICETLYSVY